MLKHTPLFETHRQLGAKLIDFGGWEMPVQYSGIIEEHLAVRNSAGVFDISHMGEITARGSGAETFLNFLLTNDAARLTPGLGQYSLMCNPQGGVVDDLYVYRLAAEEFLLIVNASRIEDDFSWMRQQLDTFPQRSGVELTNISERTGAIAVQGPRVAEFIDRAFPGGSAAGTAVPTVSALKKNEIGRFQMGAAPAWISRTGYTGEDGFELVADAEQIEAVWKRVMEHGQGTGVKPCGLGARDTLRTEVCYPLYGHELDLSTTPIEAGLGFFVALDKGEFIGRRVLAEQKAQGTQKRLVAFRMTGKGAPPRPGYAIWSTAPAAAPIGQVVSGTQSPSLSVGIGMGYVSPACAKPETPIEIEIRGRRTPGVLVKKPIYRKSQTS